jgi:VWFA-related protein
VKGLSGFALLASLAIATQQPQFRGGVSVVRLEVSVSDDRGPVRGLRNEDFVVEDSGARQTIEVEESADAPLDLWLVAQPIASVELVNADQAPRVAAGLSAFLAEIEDRDRLGVFRAGAPPTLLRALTPGRPTFDAGAFSDGMDAAPFDAIAAALREFEPSDRRGALVAFTNAADFRSTVSFDRLAEMARRLGPAFILVGVPVKVREQFGAQAQSAAGSTLSEMTVVTVAGAIFPSRLLILARTTGGIALNLADGEPRAVMANLFTWLRTRYLISYKSPPNKGWHPVIVQVKRPHVSVGVREGYFVD